MARPCKIDDPKKLEKNIEKYFLQCDENKKPYTVTGLAVSLGTTRMSLLRYKKEQLTSLPVDTREEISYLLDMAKSKCELYAQEQLFRNGNTTGIIFNLKNNHDGWIEKSEIVGLNAPEDKKVNVSGLSKEELKQLIYGDDR